MATTDEIREYLQQLAPHVKQRRAARLLREALAEIERLQDIVDRLPKTADGVCLHDLTELPYFKDGRQAEDLEMRQRGWTAYCYDGMDVHSRTLDKCYSTKEAAEAAGE